MRNLLIVLACVCVASSASAQTFHRLDLAPLGLAPITMLEDVDTDGNPATEEFVVGRPVDIVGYEYAVLAIRDGTICAGAWFTLPPMLPFVLQVQWKIGTLFGVSKFKRIVNGELQWFDLQTPSC